MYNLNLYSCFNNLCLRYYDLTVENNKRSTDNQKCIYFKDQFPNVYQEFMKVLTLVPNENNINEIAKYYKLDDSEENGLIKLLKENGIDALYDDAEYQKNYKGICDNVKRTYNALITNRYPEEIIYIYLKLLTQKLENISDADKKYLLNYLLNLLKNNSDFKPMKLSDNSVLLNIYKTLLPKNELETNEYYQMAYDLLSINYGGCQMGINDICPLHLNDTQNKNISLNRTNIDSNQISRGNNKKLLSDKNYINVPLGFNHTIISSDNDKFNFDKYIVGDKIDSNYINDEMEKIKNKYKLNNTFNIDLMGDRLYEEISNIFTKMPYNLLDYTSLLSDIAYSSLFIIDKDIDRKYFEGKLSYFAKFIISMKNGLLSPNEKICTDYILTCILKQQLSLPDEAIESIYMMCNYMKDQLDKWLIKIKPLLGLNDDWSYDKNKDTIRKKVLNNDPKLIEKYDLIMNINYTKIFTLDPSLNNYSDYNIIKSFSDSIQSYIDKIISSANDDPHLKTKLSWVNNILEDIRSEDKKDITYTNNLFLNEDGFKIYFKDILKDEKTQESKIIYDKITMIFNAWNNYIKYSLNNLFNRGIESFYNDYTYMNISRYNNCPECAKNLYKLYTEGFYKVFEEVNILKQYQELENIKSLEISWDKIFEKKNNKYILKEDLASVIGSLGSYYYKVDTYYNTIVTLSLSSSVVVINDNNTYARKIIGPNDNEQKIELKFNSFITKGSVFNEDAINKMKFYKTISVKPEDLENGKSFISPMSSNTIYTIVNDKVVYYKHLFTTLSEKGVIDNNNSVTKNKNELDPMVADGIIYTNNISDSKYIGEYLITKEGNYAYPIESMNQLEKILLQGNSNNYILYDNEVSLSTVDQYYVNVAGSDKINFKVGSGDAIELFIGNKTLSNGLINYKYNISSIKINNQSKKLVVLHIEDAKFSYQDNISNVLASNGVETKPVNEIDTGYVLFRDDETRDNLLLLVVTNEEKFKQYITSTTKNIYPVSFDYYMNEGSQFGVNIKNNAETDITKLNNLFLILNKPKITYTLDKEETLKGIPLDSNLPIYAWKYYIDNANMEELKSNIYEEKLTSTEQHLQKEFMVKDFNKLMLRKCFPNNFKRTLMCNQDVLDAIDGSKYSVPNIKIKEALCEYGKYPLYLEHYFMTSKVDYKLKGKFNLRCLANLSVLPDIVFKYLDKDDLDYTNKEVIVQGEDMIVKDGKIISSGNVYLVGIELSNDMMFKVPPTRILNKSLLNVIDFQQFDNIYSRVELLLDDSGITDYIVKPLTLENIGTLKNMKYINFY